MQIKETGMMRLQIDKFYFVSFIDLFGVGIKKNIYIQQKPLVRLKVNLLVRFSNF